MIDLKSALDSVQYNKRDFGGNSQQLINQDNTNAVQNNNSGVLSMLLKKIAPSIISGGTTPPIA